MCENQTRLKQEHNTSIYTCKCTEYIILASNAAVKGNSTQTGGNWRVRRVQLSHLPAGVRTTYLRHLRCTACAKHAMQPLNAGLKKILY